MNMYQAQQNNGQQKLGKAKALSIGTSGTIGPIGPIQPGSSRGGQGHEYPGQDLSSLSPKRNNRSSK